MKIIRNIFKKAYLAIKSRKEYSETLTDLQIKRLDICRKCPFNSDNAESISIPAAIMYRVNKILNFLMGVKVTEDSICTICTCNLIFKSSQQDPENMCPKNKWNNL